MRFKTWFPTTQSLLIVAIIDVLVTPEPGIFAMASQPSVGGAKWAGIEISQLEQGIRPP